MLSILLCNPDTIITMANSNLAVHWEMCSYGSLPFMAKAAQQLGMFSTSSTTFCFSLVFLLWPTTLLSFPNTHVAHKKQKHCWQKNAKGKKEEVLWAVLLYLNEEETWGDGRIDPGSREQDTKLEWQMYPHCGSSFHTEPISLQRIEITMYIQIQIYFFYPRSTFCLTLRTRKKKTGKLLPFIDSI